MEERMYFWTIICTKNKLNPPKKTNLMLTKIVSLSPKLLSTSIVEILFFFVYSDNFSAWIIDHNCPAIYRDYFITNAICHTCIHFITTNTVNLGNPMTTNYAWQWAFLPKYSANFGPHSPFWKKCPPTIWKNSPLNSGMLVYPQGCIFITSSNWNTTL